MLTSHIPIGKLVRVKTIGSSKITAAPPLEFVGELIGESMKSFTEGTLPGCLEISYVSEVLTKAESGSVKSERVERVMTIPKRIVKSVDQLNTVGY